MRCRLLLSIILAAGCGGPDGEADGLAVSDALSAAASLPLPGAGAGAPLVVSNNPEVFTGDGVLFSSAAWQRSGASMPLTGRFGVYLHHLNRSGASRRLRVLIWPARAGATVRAYGSGYTQAETGGLSLGHSPDARVAAEWILGRPRFAVGPVSLAPRPEAAGPAIPPASILAIFDEPVPAASEVDARFSVEASAPVYVAVVAEPDTRVAGAVPAGGPEDLRSAAPGLLDLPGAGRLGREAGIYAHDTWKGELDVRVPPPGGPARSFSLDGEGQSFPALLSLQDSAATSAGNYGVVYDLRVRLAHDGSDARARHVRVSLATAASGFGSRAWDGLWLVDGRGVQAQLTAAQPAAVLAELALAPGETRTISLRAMVPGLATIPEAIVVASR